MFNKAKYQDPSGIRGFFIFFFDNFLLCLTWNHPTTTFPPTFSNNFSTLSCRQPLFPHSFKQDFSPTLFTQFPHPTLQINTIFQKTFFLMIVH